VSYELLAGGQALVPSGVLSVSRDYTFNAQQVLARKPRKSACAPSCRTSWRS